MVDYVTCPPTSHSAAARKARSTHLSWNSWNSFSRARELPHRAARHAICEYFSASSSLPHAALGSSKTSPSRPAR
ncbi:hypothetical protein T492DRAFT_145547 [Pavlovales sp. CCMP2436]|nr:hypothetical protein T492DRAFT_145547 [Pavlovales sp. CCMP2436]